MALSAALAMSSAWVAPASALSSDDLLSSVGGYVGLSSDLHIPVLATTPHGQELVTVGSTPFLGPTIFAADRAATDYQLVLYQDMSLHLEPRNSMGGVVKLAEGFDADVPRESSTGGVDVPYGYYIDELHPNPGFHDYCTSAPNYFTTPGLNADFRGACARHDMCMEDSLVLGLGVAGCNLDLWDDMTRVCMNVYKDDENYREPCLETADVYFTAVTLANIKKF
ncbi:hypothetical protein CEPID_12420 [Corynebacterium epidermidicanis]|uniref:Phospholipase A2 n=2 Tax=Corynebacterium epidermidicanis TaxID=1050174 RepID=A0A0G3GSZ9_9CORY|nr:hypothetical protein CEPID_12420 [Corynebacterium epidermidicanis]